MTKQIPTRAAKIMKGQGRITLSCCVALKQDFYSSLLSTHNRILWDLYLYMLQIWQ